jgi:hypothetical protein
VIGRSRRAEQRTRLLAHVDDSKDAAGLVAERRAMREDLEALRRQLGGVVDIQSRKR